MKIRSDLKLSRLRLTSVGGRLSLVVVAASLAAGVVLRTVALDTTPPGLHHDEACNGYDAYSIMTTGRDHRGNLLPIAIQAFDDYRPPIFDYSLVPLIAAFGLKPAVVRLGAALWGSIDLAATTALAGLALGWPGAAAAAVLGAVSPWHLPVSRFGQEAIVGSATITLAMLCFFGWLTWRRTCCLLLSAVLLGLSLYSYSVTKLFTPLMIGLLTTLYWRELKLAWPGSLMALAVLALLAAPQAVLTLGHTAEMQARFNQNSLFAYMATCPNCLPAAARAAGDSIPNRLENFSANWAGYFTPSYLFFAGDRGDHWALLHPPGFGQLLPEQAPLIALALLALVSGRRRKLVILLAAWLVLAALPAALTVPSGAWQPEPGLPTPSLLMDRYAPNVPLTPGLLLSHPDARRDTLAIVPWTVLSAVGFVVLLDLTAQLIAVRSILVAVLAASTIFHEVRFVRSYFRDYPIVAAPYFRYGIEDALKAIRGIDDGHEPVVISSKIDQAYIYVLFFDRYPPERFQHGTVTSLPGKYLRIVSFDRYLFVKPAWAYSRVNHGIFLFPGIDTTPAPPTASVRYPDGRIAYQIVVK